MSAFTARLQTLQPLGKTWQSHPDLLEGQGGGTQLLLSQSVHLQHQDQIMKFKGCSSGFTKENVLVHRQINVSSVLK